MDLDSVADELYALPPQEFVAARNAQEKQARADGNRELAGQIRQLGKPTNVAWLANQLVRERRDEIDPFLELGAGLREATTNLSGDDLRRLSQQQHQVTHALVLQAGRIAAAAGHELTDATARGLEETLRAALADGDLAEQLAAGRLTGALEHVGFGAGPAGQRAERTPRSEPAAAGSSSNQRSAARLERLQRDVDQAQAAADTAADDDERAQAALREASETARTLSDTVDRLQRELDEALRAHARSERDERQARSKAADSARATQKAGHRLKEATALLDSERQQ